MIKSELKFLKALNGTDLGAFLKWKPDEDIFLPASEQIGDIYEGERYFVMIIFDDKKNKYFATEKIGDQLETNTPKDTFTIGHKIEGIVYSFSPLGANIMIGDGYTGLIFENDIYEDLHVGDTINVIIKDIRTDGKITLALKKQGYRNVISSSTEQILTKLKSSDGFLAFNDKSNPDDIKQEFKMSKKQFKQAIGKLYKSRQIKITPKGIELTN